MISCVYTLIFIPVGGNKCCRKVKSIRHDSWFSHAEPFDVRTDPGGDISLDRGYARRDGAEMGRN